MADGVKLSKPQYSISINSGDAGCAHRSGDRFVGGGESGHVASCLRGSRRVVRVRDMYTGVETAFSRRGGFIRSHGWPVFCRVSTRLFRSSLTSFCMCVLLLTFRRCFPFAKGDVVEEAGDEWYEKTWFYIICGAVGVVLLCCLCLLCWHAHGDNSGRGTKPLGPGALLLFSAMLVLQSLTRPTLFSFLFQGKPGFSFSIDETCGAFLALE